MYTLLIKESRASIDVPMVRSLLTFSIILMLVYRQEHSLAINLSAALVLLTISLSTQYLVVRRRVAPLILIGIAALLVIVATQNWLMALLLLLVGLVLHFSYVPPRLHISETGIRIQKTLLTKTHPWSEFNNVLLKDNLLTLDFASNKVLQLETADTGSIDEAAFNRFCAGKLQG